MELRTGYKQTEVGVIPDDWFVRTIGEISIKIGSGITPTGGVKVYKQTGLPFIRSQNIGRGYLVLDDVAYIDQQIHATFSGSEIKADDVFLNITGASIGRSAIADERVQGGNVNQHVCIIRPSKNELNSKFLKSILLSDYGQRKIDSFQAGGNREGLNFSQIRSLIIPLPSLTEQVAIANALSDADALIQSLQKLITKKRQIKQGAMQTLLNPYEKGELKDGWVIIKLGDVCDIKDGTHQTPRYVDSGIPFYSVESVTRNDFVNTKFVSHEEHKLLTKSFRIQKGDVLMTRIGSIGDCKYIDWDVNASFYVSLALLKFKNGLSAQFLTHYSESSYFKKEAEINSLQYAIPKKINLGQIAEIKIGIPKAISQQDTIAALLTSMESEIFKLETKLAKYQQIKQGMMQSLLTGRIRLV